MDESSKINDTKSERKIKNIIKRIDKQTIDSMIIWRIVLAKMATLNEIETTWSFDNIMDANEILDIKEDIEQASTPEIKDN